MNTDREIKKLRKEIENLATKIESLLDNKSDRNNLITVTEFAKKVGCSRGTVINRINRGVYGAVRVGNKYYLPRP